MIKTNKENFPNTTLALNVLDNIFLWGIQRGITVENGATALSQMKKLKEELDELDSGLQTNDLDEIRDSIGDMYVVLQQIARLSGLSMYECLGAAWDDIKDRRGLMRHGVFVKQADIDLIGMEALNAATSAEELRHMIQLAKDTDLSAEVNPAYPADYRRDE